MYTFHLFRADEGSTAFEAHELEFDAQAPERAQRLLEEHPSCVRVTVWDGDREVLQWPPGQLAAAAHGDLA